MRLTIHGFNFWMPSNGGYIRLVDNEHPGTLGAQITRNGSAIAATPETFERVCRGWYLSQLTPERSNA